MLLTLAKWLATSAHGFQVFNYITLRAVLATLTAMSIAFIAGPAFIRKMGQHGVQQTVRSDGPSSHFCKTGTPTMGGGLILIAVLVATLLWADLSNRFIWVVLLTTLSFGIIGWVDDWCKVVQQQANGLSARVKFSAQAVLGLSAAVFLYTTANTASETTLLIPFFKNLNLSLGAFGFITLSFLVIVGASNAVNLTDGLDGLAIMPSVLISVALGVFAYTCGHFYFSRYLGIIFVPGAGELLVFCAALSGAGLGFLWFNTYPAEVFMGDVGALAIGAGLGVVAIIVRQEIVFFVMSGVFVVETLSVVLQVGYFKYTKWRHGTGRRILLMAPLHHHFERRGWKETQVVVRFWIITMILVLVGLSTLKIR